MSQHKTIQELAFQATCFFSPLCPARRGNDGAPSLAGLRLISIGRSSSKSQGNNGCEAAAIAKSEIFSHLNTSICAAEKPLPSTESQSERKGGLENEAVKTLPNRLKEADNRRGGEDTSVNTLFSEIDKLKEVGK